MDASSSSWWSSIDWATWIGRALIAVFGAAAGFAIRRAYVWFKNIRRLNRTNSELTVQLEQSRLEVSHLRDELGQAQRAIEDLTGRLDAAQQRISSLERSLALGARKFSWSPPRTADVTWYRTKVSGLYYPLEVPTEFPYLVCFDVVPGNSKLWRCGAIFSGAEILDPQLLIHVGKVERGFSVHIYAGYPFADGKNLGQAMLMRSVFAEQVDRVSVVIAIRSKEVVLRVDHWAWVVGEEDLGLVTGALSNPALVAWCDNDVCHIEVENGVVRAEDAEHTEALDHLATMTAYNQTLRKQLNDAEQRRERSIELPQFVYEARGCLLSWLRQRKAPVSREELEQYWTDVTQRSQLDREAGRDILGAPGFLMPDVQKAIRFMLAAEEVRKVDWHVNGKGTVAYIANEEQSA